MIKVLIVDDEKPIREWFVHCVEKSKKYQLVGQAANGQAAMELFEAASPDIVVTDIKMPIMDGLEFMHRAKNINSTASFIILSNYADFEYARHAIKLGANEYVLKTEVDEQDFLAILDKVSSKRSAGLFSRVIDFSDQILNKDTVNFITGNIAKEFSIEGKSFFTVALNINNDQALQKLYSITDDVALENKISNCCLVKLGLSKYIILANLDSVPSFLLRLSYVYKFCLKIGKIVDTKVGSSNIYDHISLLANAITESFSALNTDFLASIKKPLSKNAPSETSAVKSVEEFMVKYSNSLKAKNFNLLYESLNGIFDIIESGCITDVEYIKYILSDCIYSAHHLIKNSEEPLPQINAEFILKFIDSSTDFYDLKAFILNTVGVLQESFRKGTPYSSDLINRAINYIKCNYNKQISLTEIAGSVDLNPEYFSRLFKSETGQNVSMFLMTYRLKIAGELLKTTNLKLYQVGEMVGYYNPSYFSRLYKKYSSHIL